MSTIIDQIPVHLYLENNFAAHITLKVAQMSRLLTGT